MIRIPGNLKFYRFGSSAVVTCLLFCGTALADVIHTVSDIKGAQLIPLGALPHSPENGSLDEYCEGFRAKKLGAAGQQVAGLGWIVTSEAALGRYHVVTFASGFTPGTSGICFARNGNIGIFDGTTLIALAYTSRAAGWHFGNVEPLESGALLIWGGDGPFPPVGELRQEDGGLRLTEVAPERSFCRGKAVVPNVYGKSIEVARKILIAQGWRPTRPAEKPQAGDAAAGLAKHGVIEAEGCSGTGVGYCGFSYHGASGVLSVVTVGGDPEPANNTITSYNVNCFRK